MRLDLYLAQYYPEYSRSQWQKYIAAGYVKVNSAVVVSPKYKLDEDDHVTYEIATDTHQEFNVSIIYEDENVIVFNKPAGMLTHAKGGIIQEQTIADLIRPHTTYAQDTNRPGIVHRLDRDTSGVIVTVKNPDTAKLLQKQFTNRTVKKKYSALVIGHLSHKEARIELPIERDPKKPSQFRVGANGKSATTKYQVIKESKHYSLVVLAPKTGRTHQLRVHMAYVKTPILGDKVYGKSADRLYLHAESIEITLPGGVRKVFTALLPDTFHATIDNDE